MTKKVIVHLIQSLDNGGCENMLLRTLPLVNKFDHIIITLRNGGELAKLFQEKGITVISINQNNLVDINSYRRLLNTIKSLNPNLIITYLFHADLVGRIVLQSVQKIKVIPFLRTTYNHKKYWQARLFEKISKGWVTQYLANSESVRDYYVKQIGVEKNKVTVIPNGIDTDYYNKIPKDQTLRKELGFHNNDIVLICVANLHVNKGHKLLLKAFEDLYKTHRNIKLLLIGDGAEKENLQKQIKNYNSKNCVFFLGKRNDVPKLLKISDIFVLPTLFEGMSNAIMEAMASGVPVAVSDIKENKELLGETGGYYFQTNNSVAISRAIETILISSEEAHKIALNGKEIISKKYDQYLVANKLSKIISIITENK
ncbi:MAG: hypothetical protein C0412_02890 [Flavobacterium sp.]|nr:hypothetical protein [Flavobacterium sp.]